MQHKYSLTHQYTEYKPKKSALNSRLCKNTKQTDTLPTLTVNLELFTQNSLYL